MVIWVLTITLVSAALYAGPSGSVHDAWSNWMKEKEELEDIQVDDEIADAQEVNDSQEEGM